MKRGMFIILLLYINNFTFGQIEVETQFYDFNKSYKKCGIEMFFILNNDTTFLIKKDKYNFEIKESLHASINSYNEEYIEVLICSCKESLLLKLNKNDVVISSKIRLKLYGKRYVENIIISFLNYEWLSIPVLFKKVK